MAVGIRKVIPSLYNLMASQFGISTRLKILNFIFFFTVRIIIFLWGSRHIFYVNTKYRTSSQNTTKFIVLCCTICFTTTCFGTFSLGHLQVVYTRLEANVSCIQIYYINDDIAVIIVQLKS